MKRMRYQNQCLPYYSHLKQKYTWLQECLPSICLNTQRLTSRTSLQGSNQKNPHIESFHSKTSNFLFFLPLCSLHMHLELSQMLKIFSTLYYFPSPNLDRVFPHRKKIQRKNVFLYFHSAFLYQNPRSSHFHLHFSLHQLWKVLPPTSETSSINTPHRHEVSRSIHIYSLASPPRIHMDSWWVARNSNQGPKYFLRPICSLWA